MTERFQFRYVKEFSGSIIILIIVLTVVALFVGIHAEKWLAPEHSVRVILPEEGSYGLRKGAEVQILGTVAGHVQEIEINTEGRMEAILNIFPDFFQFIRQDSLATIRKSFGLMGGGVYLEISTGKGESLNGKVASINSMGETDLRTLVVQEMDRLREVFLPAFQEYGKLATDLRNPDGALQQLLEKLNHIATNIEDGEGVAAKLINDKSMADNVEKALTGTNEILSELQIVLKDTQITARRLAEVTNSIGAQLETMPRLTSQSEQVLTDMQVVLVDIHSLLEIFPSILTRLDQEMETLPGMFLQTKATLQEIERLVSGMQKHWLIRQYIEQPQTTPRLNPAEIKLER